MYGGDIGASGGGGGGNWKAPEDPSLVVGGKEEVSSMHYFGLRSFQGYNDELFIGI